MLLRLFALPLLFLATIGCGPGRQFVLPTSPNQTTPPIYVQPQPRQFPPFDITTVVVGDVISRTNLDAPECVDFLGWPCLYFRIVAPSTGVLLVDLVYAKGTQGNQGVDISLRQLGARTDVWAQTFSQTDTRAEALLTAQVVEGRTYDLTLWYTFTNFEYELRTSMK